MSLMYYFPQLDETDCGAACLAMVASHFKSRLSIAAIRQIAGTDQKGTNLAGMVQASKKLGFDAKALKGNAEALTAELPLPFIAHVSISHAQGTLLHYVVVKAIGKDHVEVWDPSPDKKKQKLKREDFLKLWTGYVIFLSPAADFKPEKGGNLLLRFLPLLRPHTGTLALAGVTSILLILFGILGSFYFRYIIDEVLLSRAQFTLTALSIGMLVLVVFQAVLGVVRNILLTHFSFKADVRLLFSYVSHVLRLPLGFFDSRKTGEILSRLEDAGKIRQALSQAALSVVMDTLMILVIGPVLFFTSPTLFFILLVTVPLASAVVIIFSRLYRKRYRQLMVEGADLQSYLVESVNGVNTVKAMNAQARVFHEYERKQMRVVREGWSASRLSIWQGMCTELIQGLGNTVIFWVGSWFIMQGQLSIGTLISFNALAAYFIGPLQRLINLQSGLQEAFVAADRLGEILDLEGEIVEGGKWLKPAEIGGRIDFRAVAFRYGTRKPVYQNLALSIQAGEWVAFVGPSGCGKTTLAKLLFKFYQPESGDILLDGHNLQDIDTLFLRSRIGYVPQEVFLFSGSIAENIALHQPDASLEEIVEAARRAGADEFIVNLPERYNTKLGERGATLSGGERQRLALARALLGSPDILILDEATSNLDAISERRIHDTIACLRTQRITTILIAHRLSTVTACDRIFVIDQGAVVQSGPHAQLVAEDGLYRSLWEGVLV
jgi:ATP-binding cassette subfamily B protein